MSQQDTQEAPPEYNPGDMLSEETMKQMLSQMEDLAESICAVGFIDPQSGLMTQASKDTGILAITALMAERALLRSLVQRSIDARTALYNSQ